MDYLKDTHIDGNLYVSNRIIVEGRTKDQFLMGDGSVINKEGSDIVITTSTSTKGLSDKDILMSNGSSIVPLPLSNLDDKYVYKSGDKINGSLEVIGLTKVGSLDSLGLAKASSLDITGLSETDSLDVRGLTKTDSLEVTKLTKTNSLEVTNETTLSNISSKGNIKIMHAVVNDNTYASSNPNIILSKENETDPIKILYVNDSSYRSGRGIKIIGNIEDCWFEAPKVYGAVWNDLADLIIVPNNTKLEYGKCYYTNGENYSLTKKYCQKGIIGIHSDTAGFSMGAVKDKKQLHVAVAGFVLAYVDKRYPSGTPLTCTKNGYLTKISFFSRIIHPERIVGTYWKDEYSDKWNGIKVNNRNWIKIK